MKSFHDQGRVYDRDLRDVNTLCGGEKSMAVDFGWSGKDGEISYSISRQADGTKRRESDIQVLERTLAKIKYNSFL